MSQKSKTSLKMAYFAHDRKKTDIAETNLKFKAFQGMMSSSGDCYVDFLLMKLEAVVAQKDSAERLHMIESDKWLKAGFYAFHKEASSFPIAQEPPLYISKPEQYKRALCETCDDHFECSRNFKGKVIMCARCDANDASNKKRKMMAAESDDAVRGEKAVASSMHSVASRDDDEDAIRKIRALDVASWRDGR